VRKTKQFTRSQREFRHQSTHISLVLAHRLGGLSGRGYVGAGSSEGRCGCD